MAYSSLDPQGLALTHKAGPSFSSGRGGEGCSEGI